MPAAEKTWPIDELIDAVREHAEVTRSLVTLEYVVIAGVNCGPTMPRRCASSCAAFRCG